MTQSSQSETAAVTICVALREGGRKLVEVSPRMYARYDDLRHRRVLTHEQLERLATHDGAADLTAEAIVAVLGLPEQKILESLAELDRAAAAIAGGLRDAVLSG